MFKRKADETISEPPSKALKTCHNVVLKRRDLLILHFPEVGLMDIIEDYIDLGATVNDQRLAKWISGVYQLILWTCKLEWKDCPLEKWSEKSLPAMRKLFHDKFLNDEKAMERSRRFAQEWKNKRNQQNQSATNASHYNTDSYYSFLCLPKDNFGNLDDFYEVLNIVDPTDTLATLLPAAEIIKALEFVGTLICTGTTLQECVPFTGSQFRYHDIYSEMYTYSVIFLCQVFL